MEHKVIHDKDLGHNEPLFHRDSIALVMNDTQYDKYKSDSQKLEDFIVGYFELYDKYFSNIF